MICHLKVTNNNHVESKRTFTYLQYLFQDKMAFPFRRIRNRALHADLERLLLLVRRKRKRSRTS
jgi:hypothetical protein